MSIKQVQLRKITAYATLISQEGRLFHNWLFLRRQSRVQHITGSTQQNVTEREFMDTDLQITIYNISEQSRQTKFIYK